MKSNGVNKKSVRVCATLARKYELLLLEPGLDQ